MTETSSTSSPAIKPCPKCGQPGAIRKAGSNRVWVQCAKYGKDGNCTAISRPEANKKDAITVWNKMK